MVVREYVNTTDLILRPTSKAKSVHAEDVWKNAINQFVYYLLVHE